MEEIGKRLKQILKEKEMNALEFSERVGIQRSSLSHLFSGRNKPSIDLLLKIKKQFPETDLDWLITGEESITPVYFDKNQSIRVENEPKNVVTDVNKEVLKSDYQYINHEEGKLNKAIREQHDIERIILFYTDGSFKEYKN